MPEAKIEETVCEDRISALPEDLLVTILLLVPIRDAVATMLLSKRWRFIWMMLPRLDYKESSDNDNDPSKKSIWWFFDKSMELHKAPILEVLLIKLGPGCPSDADVGKWLTKAVDRQVGVLKFELCWSTGPTRLPKSLYTCETLKELTLSHNILVDFPSFACLPSLSTLELFYVVYKDEASLFRFLSSCPVLDLLDVKRNTKHHDNVNKFSVKVPSLQFFWYENCDYTSLPDTARCLTIDTPALIDFIIADYSRDSWSFENIPCLEKAFFDVRSFPDIDKSKTSISGLVRCSTINFSRLIKLTIYPHNSDWLEPLLPLLENAPNLKDLLVTYECTVWPRDRIPLSWNQPCSVPRCMLSHLEIFEYRKYGAREEEEEFLTYIFANSKCLKTVTISVKPSSVLGKKELIIEELRNIPRVSTSQLLLF
ncbi:hypothetical protein CARUB_v10007564mg [Capsella rubella]|uniref:FBD domain-containing protein n=1 Tax=Capsella rubella TaxID=81985 RepID=R0H5W9_9BRAS|nr:hypothetical protein CARUB_v10007564mg [Capsella rubella]